MIFVGHMSSSSQSKLYSLFYILISVDWSITSWKVDHNHLSYVPGTLSLLITFRHYKNPLNNKQTPPRCNGRKAPVLVGVVELKARSRTVVRREVAACPPCSGPPRTPTTTTTTTTARRRKTRTRRWRPPAPGRGEGGLTGRWVFNVYLYHPNNKTITKVAYPRHGSLPHAFRSQGTSRGPLGRRDHGCLCFQWKVIFVPVLRSNPCQIA